MENQIRLTQQINETVVKPQKTEQKLTQNLIQDSTENKPQKTEQKLTQNHFDQLILHLLSHMDLNTQNHLDQSILHLLSHMDLYTQSNIERQNSTNISQIATTNPIPLVSQQLEQSNFAPNKLKKPPVQNSDNVSHRTLRRLQNQRKQILQNQPIYWRLKQSPKWNIWHILIKTEINTPFHSDRFKLIVTFPENYPFEPPKFQLEDKTRFFHPNISSSTGSICQQTLKSKQIHLTTRQRIDAFINLLSTPNPDNPLNREAATLYSANPRQYYRKAFKIFNGNLKMGKN